MKITVLRHGVPNINNLGRFSAVEFGRWIKDYNAVGIDEKMAPPAKVMDTINEKTYVVCSHLPRSLESASRLGVRHIHIQDSMFRECDMPYADWNFPKLSLKAWAVIFRIFQLLGYSFNAESIDEARRRADACTARLIQYANEHQSVLFVGHGSLNWLIHKRLVQKGWQGPKKSSRRHWEIGVYRYS